MSQSQTPLTLAKSREAAGDFAGAASLLRQAVQSGGGPAAMIALGGVLISAGQLAEASNILARAAKRGGAELTFQQARLAEAQGRMDEAASQYRAASRAEPRHAAARLGLARVLIQLDRPDEARAALEALLARAPDHVEALRQLAWLHGNQRRFADALACYDRLEGAGEDVAAELAQVTLGFMHICDWSRRDALRARLEARFAEPRPCRVNPYVLLALTDDPAAHRPMAERIADTIRASVAGLPRPAVSRRGAGGRLRIGYLGGDLNQHATSLLLAGVIEAHDRGRFDIAAYDYSAEDGSPIRARMVAAFERFVRIGQLGVADTAARIAADGVDILIDLSGYTDRPRSEVLALRPAPAQVNFLGYVATQGADWIDYVIADSIVLPGSDQPDWRERILHMPVTYYPSDRTRPLPAPDTDRARHGLPAEGFVFTCFNNPYKIAPDIFAVWMRLLREVPGSVLWLYEGNAFVAANLRREAAAADISPGRLVFAPPVALDAHLARHGCADLFLDTLPYGAHTTGVDALWAGVPMVTCPGRSFASRVGASLLRSVGQEELIAGSLADYFDLAVSLARDPVRLGTLRRRLSAGRDTAPLFDATAFARGLEGLFEQIAARQIPSAG